MSRTNELAILMSVKNGEQFLNATVESILAQTYSNFTLVAVDDHSEDDSVKILESFKDPRIIVLKAPEHGIPSAMNFALDHYSNYRFIARHDADDVSYPQRFAKQIDYLTQNPDVSVLSTQANRADDKDRPLDDFPQTPLEHGAIVALLKKWNPICQGSVMFRPDAVMSVGGYNTNFPLAEGYELWVRLAKAGYKFACLPDYLYMYRLYQTSFTRSRVQTRDEMLEQVRQLAADLF